MSSIKRLSMDALQSRIVALPCWSGPVTLEPLGGGLSNVAFVVRDGAARYVARCGDDIPVHHVFRDSERAATLAAHAAGIGPEMVYAEGGIMVLRFVAGRTFVEADLRANLARIAALLAACHRGVARHLAGPAGTFHAFRVIRDYLRTLEADSAAPRTDLRHCAALADALEARQVPLPEVFGHHDLLPGNFIDDGERIWLIDWEYAAFGTAMFDLANLSSNGNFAPDDDTALLDAYFEAPVDEAVRCAFDAMKVGSALREAAWAMVSERHLGVPGADYRAHAALYLARTEEARTRFEARHGRL